jgi:hypothetical protein
MSKKQKAPSALAIDFKLAGIRERCLSDGALTDDFWRSYRLFEKPAQKLDQDRERFIQRADAEQRKRINKLWQFLEAAKYGPALSVSWKRTRRARLFEALCKIISRLEPAPGFPPSDLPGATKALTAILKAAQKDDEFWNDGAIAAKLKNTRSGVNWFLAEYSWLMLGRRPALTFADLHKILHWIKPADLRKKIRKLRQRYGELAVPLKRGKPGRPRIKKIGG